MFHVGEEQIIRYKGKSYRLARFVRRLLRRWYRWALSRIPNPLEVVDESLPFIPEEIQDKVIEEAGNHAAQRNSLEAESLLALWHTNEGLLYVFTLLIREYQPELTDRQIKAIFDQLDDVQAVIIRASGQSYVSEEVAEEEAFREAGLLPPKAEKKRLINGVRVPDMSTDWSYLDRQLFQNFYITPREVDEMTMPEIEAICRQDKKSEAVVTDNVGDYTELSRKYHLLSPTQKLRLMYRKYPL